MLAFSFLHFGHTIWIFVDSFLIISKWALISEDYTLFIVISSFPCCNTKDQNDSLSCFMGFYWAVWTASIIITFYKKKVGGTTSARRAQLSGGWSQDVTNQHRRTWKKRTKGQRNEKIENQSWKEEIGEQSQESLGGAAVSSASPSAGSIAREWSRDKHEVVPLYFCAGIMLSMASPFSSFFSISTISLTPSTTNWTWATSEEPRRSALEMSNTPPTEAVSTPPEEDKGWQITDYASHLPGSQ